MLNCWIFLFDLDCHCSLKVTNHPFIYYVALTACIITTKFNKEMNFEQDILFIHLTVGNMPTIKLSHSWRGNRNVWLKSTRNPESMKQCLQIR